MKRTKTIEWLHDIDGEEPEIPQGKRIKHILLKWSYKRGQQIRVQELEDEGCFWDIAGGHQISRIPNDAYRSI